MKPLGWLHFFVSGLAACVVMAGQARAGLLDLPEQYPDVMSDGITVVYTLVEGDGGSTGEFTAEGTPQVLTIGGSPVTQFTIGGARSVNIALTLDRSTGAPLSGSLTILGEIDASGPGPTTGTLLTGDILQFGFHEAGLFDFFFDVTGGDLQEIYGDRAGMLLDAGESTFGGDFQSEFDNQVALLGMGAGVADTFAVAPEPSSASLAVVACGLAAPVSVWRRKRRR